MVIALQVTAMASACQDYRGAASAPDMSVLVNNCITHSITILEHLIVLHCAVPLLFLLEMYEWVDIWVIPFPLSMGCDPTESGTDWTVSVYVGIRSIDKGKVEQTETVVLHLNPNFRNCSVCRNFCSWLRPTPLRLKMLG